MYNTYLDLLAKFPPRPIRSDEQLAQTQVVIDSLIDGELSTQDEQDYLNVLGALVYEYEQTLEPPFPDRCEAELIDKLTPIAYGAVRVAREGRITSRAIAEMVLELIDGEEVRHEVEPLWRALKFKLTGDSSYLMVNPIIKEVTEDVLKVLRF